MGGVAGLGGVLHTVAALHAGGPRGAPRIPRLHAALRAGLRVVLPGQGLHRQKGGSAGVKVSC